MAEDILKQLEIKLKERRMNISKLGKLLDIPPDRMYKWYYQNTNPKPTDAVKVWDWINGAENIQISKADEDDPQPDYQKKYIALLEEMKDRLLDEKDSKSREQETNLVRLSVAQVSIQSRLDALFRAFAQVASGGDAKKADRLMKEWDTQKFSSGTEKPHKGSVTDGHTVNKLD